MASELTEAELEAAGGALARASGVSLASGLRLRLRDAVAAAARQLGVEAGALVSRAVAGDPAATGALVEHALVGETSFWRHPDGLAALAARLAGAPGPLAIWSTGCASGEEPYSLRIALLEAGRERTDDRLLATDLSTRALDQARAGAYQAHALRHLPPALVARWLEPGAAGARVVPRLAEGVTWARHNLLDPPPPGPFDAILCRNVLIYFEPEVASTALRRLVGALRPGGWLLVAPVELSLATGLPLEWVEQGGATLLRRYSTILTSAT
jgi:chemotaxis protein methyltransferase CheR